MPKTPKDKHRRGHGEGTIHQRKDGRWAAALTVEGSKRKWFYGKTRKEVASKLSKALNEQQEGKLILAKNQSLEAYLNHWLPNVSSMSILPQSYVKYEMLIRNHILPSLGSKTVQKLAPQDLQSFYAFKLSTGLSSKYVRSMHAVLHKALDTAVRWNLIYRNPCDLVDPPKVPKSRIVPLSEEQTKAFLECAKSDPYEALYILALTTTMRQGELFGLKWRDIDMERGIINVSRNAVRLPKQGTIEAMPKTDSGRRSIMLTEGAIEALKQHRTKQLAMRLRTGPAWEENDLVFSTHLGTPLLPSNFRVNHFHRLLKLAGLYDRPGLPRVRFHDLRHSSATLLLTLGVSLKVIQEMLGHSSIRITADVYTHVLPSAQKDATNRLNEFFKSTS